MTIVAETSERIAAAREIIGADASSDYVMAPTEHARLYQSSAPDLAEVLRSSEVEVAARQYTERDAAALSAQTEFRTAYRRARTAVFIAGIAAAALMVAGVLSGALSEAWSRTLLVGASIIGVVGGALAGLWIRRIGDGRLLETWMTRRAAAETERLRYFELITKRAQLNEPLLQLEYFRRYQLDVQRAYYRTRSQQHRADANRAVAHSSGGIALASVGNGLAGVLALTLSSAWAAIAGLGLLGQAFATAVENSEATSQDRRNAERYDRTRESLDQLYALLDKVRAATAAGDLEALHSFVDSVNDQLSLEHRQWLEEFGAASQAVTRLQTVLEQYQEKLPKAPAN
jgi:hypothetical protein